MRSLDIGSDTGTPVDDNDYSTPFTFSGKLNKITLDIDRPKLSPDDIKRLQDAARAAGDAASVDGATVGTTAATGTASTQSAAPQVSGDVGLNLSQKVELSIDKREGCRKQAEAQGLAILERIQFVRKCMQ